MSAEEILQTECIKLFRYMYPKLKRVLVHIPNGGKREKKCINTKAGPKWISLEAVKLKKMGTMPGAADLILFVPRKGYGSLAIELKTATGIQSPEQKEFQSDFTAAGNKYVICRNTLEFENTIKDYLS